MGCTFDWRDQSVVKTFSGFITGSEFVRSAETVGADRRFDTLRIIYNDFLGIDGHSIDARAYARVAAARAGAALSNPNFRVAFIASGPAAQDLSRAIAGAGSSAASYHPMVCATMAAGRAWFAAQPALDGLRHGH